MRKRTPLYLFVAVLVGATVGDVGCGEPSGLEESCDATNLVDQAPGDAQLQDVRATDDGLVGDASLDVPTVSNETGPSDAGDANDGSTDGGSVPIPSGIPEANNSNYTDLGPAPPGDGFRALLGFRPTNEAALDTAIDDIYAPGSGSFRQYPSGSAALTAYGPVGASLTNATSFLVSCGFAVPRTAANRLLLEFTGTIGQFNACFLTDVHRLQRISNPSVIVYGIPPPATLSLPGFLAPISNGILTLDLPAPVGTLLGEAGSIVVLDPGTSQYTPAALSHAYHASELATLGHTGAGAKIGVVGTNHFKFKDVQSFWKSFGVTRADPVAVETMEPIVSRSSETTAAIEWAGALAPGAALTVYEGPDFSSTSLLYTLNEAVGRNEVDIVTMSHSRRESAEGAPTRQMVQWIGKMAALTGVTVVSSSGNDMNPELPAVSSFVTAVGGSDLSLDVANDRVSEVYWRPSLATGGGTGDSISIAKPDYQAGLSLLAGASRRATVDLAVTAKQAYWVYWLANWESGWGGTELSAPVFAGLLGRIQSYRASLGKPRAGWLNRALYTDTSVRSSFFDITSGSAFISRTATTVNCGAGWDYPTGWGAPHAMNLAQTLP